MDSQLVTVDQFASAIAAIQESIARLGQRIEGQQAPHDQVHDDFTAPPPPPPPTVQQAASYVPLVLHGQTEMTPPPAIVLTLVVDDTHARMDRLEQLVRQMRVSEGATWDDFDSAPATGLPLDFKMPEIERYTGRGCPRVHLRLYTIVMRAHRLDEAQMLMLFPMSLSGVAQSWYASLDASRRRTWEDLTHEFLRHFAFSTVVDVSRRELEAMRQGSEETVTSFISRWREKIVQMVDRPSQREQISMLMRSLQPKYARHLMGFPQTDIGALIEYRGGHFSRIMV